MRTPNMASTSCNRDASTLTATHSSKTPLPIHGHASARTTTHVKRERVATTPLPVHSGQRDCGHGRENTCARETWPPRVATETHRHTPRRTRVQHRSPSIGTRRHAAPRTTSDCVSLQRCSSSTPASEDPATVGKTRAHAIDGLQVLQSRPTGTHHHPRQARACRYNTAPRPLQPSGLRLRAGKHVRTPIRASTCCNRDASTHTATHSSKTPLPIHGHAPARITTHGKQKRVATTPLPVHYIQRGSGHGRENTCAR